MARDAVRDELARRMQMMIEKWLDERDARKGQVLDTSWIEGEHHFTLTLTQRHSDARRGAAGTGSEGDL